MILWKVRHTLVLEVSSQIHQLSSHAVSISLAVYGMLSKYHQSSDPWGIVSK
jgi:hypothetical protein